MTKEEMETYIVNNVFHLMETEMAWFAKGLVLKSLSGLDETTLNSIVKIIEEYEYRGL